MVSPGILNLFMAILLWKTLKQSYTDEREIYPQGHRKK